MAETITAKELAYKVIHHEKTFILDVRNTDEFDNWKIEGKTVDVINEPYFNLLEGVDPVANKLNKDQEIIVVCAKGGSSEMVADMLKDAGFTSVYSLEGGMKAWGEHLEPVKISDLNGKGSLYQFVRLGKGCLSYMIESNGEAAVVDASRMIDVYEKFAEDHGMQIKHVMDTHLHADHISGGRELANHVGGTYYLPPKDATEVTFNYTTLEEGKPITVGNIKVDVQPLYSPGHTVGSTSLVIDDSYLLTGDILFVKSIGRPDLAGLAGEWADDLHHTLYSRYKELSADLTVLPAHYSFAEELGEGGKVSARLGDLYKQNAGLQVDNKDDFRKMVTENLPPQPNAYDKIRQTNMGQINPELEEQQEMESGPNRCAIEG